uniref:restriction endonuclease subunit S n=1 Tax=Pararhizobium sp. IMCC3301 TaxID=3067904 RepID=UPI0027411D21|nr:restriction endonuclease subunit S [Pararhizobium sp. IMCC3301]
MKAGWDVRPLEHCLDRFRVPAKIQRKQFRNAGTFPIVSQEADFINGYWDEAADVCVLDRPVVIFGDHTQVLKYVDFDFVVGADGVKVLAPKPFIDAKYLYYFVMANRAPSLGYARHYRHVKELAISYPDPEEQQRIVAVLDEAFEGLARARAHAEANLQNARELFDSAIDHVFGKASEWPSPQISSLGEVFDGPHATPKTVDDGPLFLGISSLVDGRIELTKTRHVTEENFAKWTRRITPRPRDVVFSYETRLGQVGIIPAGMRCCLGRRMGLIRLNPALIDPEYFVLCYLSPHFQNFLRSKTIKGATVDRLSIKDFPQFLFPTPSQDQQAEIVSRVHAIRNLHDNLLKNAKFKLQDLDDLRQSLLQKAFAGELT